MFRAVDMHCDTVLNLMKGASLYENEGHVSLCKMKKGNYLLQCFATYVDLAKCTEPYNTANTMIDRLEEEFVKFPEIISKVTSYSDILKADSEGKLCALLTLEEGEIIEGDLKKLQHFYDRGVRMMTLTWNHPNKIGCPNATDENDVETPFWIPNTVNGLTAFGKETVEFMEEIGMIVDISHVSDAVFYDVCDMAKKPFVASHSNARATCRHARNLTDDMIRKLAEHGGVTGLNYEYEFLDDVEDYKKSVGRMSDMVKAVMHIRNVGGYEVLGLGSDYDGINTPPHMKDASEVPFLAEALIKAGMPSSEIDAMFSRNVLRVFKECMK